MRESSPEREVTGERDRRGRHEEIGEFAGERSEEKKIGRKRELRER